jgi:cytochrome c peroxidase
LTDGQCHNTGVPTAQGLKLDLGRASGLQKLATSEFSCTSKYSDAKAEQCLGSAINSEPYDTSTEAQPMNGAFKTPTLRGVTLHAPFMHAGQFSTIAQVLKYYNNAPVAPAGKTEIKALRLTNLEMQQLETFLKSLEAPVNADAKWLTDPFSN